MTIAISIKVGEGLVYACDSTSTFFDHSAGKPDLVQSFHHARKLIQLEDYPIGLMTFGLGSIGARNLESLVAEFETTLTPVSLLGENDYSVAEIAGDLKTFLTKKYETAFPPPVAPAGGAAVVDTRPQMGVVIGGYSSDQFFPDEFLISFPDAQVVATRSAAGIDFGALWWGITAPILRLVGGIDPSVQQWFVDKGVDAAEAVNLLTELRGRLQWSIVFDGMPLQDPTGV